MAGSRAFQRRSPRGRCPSCGKLGLGDIKHSVVGSRGIAYRACRYCGDQVTLVDKDPPSQTAPASDKASAPPPSQAFATPLPTAELRSGLVAYTAAWAVCDGGDMAGVDAAMARVSEALDALDRRLGTTPRERPAYD